MSEKTPLNQQTSPHMEVDYTPRMHDSSSTITIVSPNLGSVTLLKPASNRSVSENGASLVRTAINISIVVNVVLAFAKGYAAYISGSLAVLASLIDSILDLASQAVISYTEQQSTLGSNTAFPAGQRRMEPIGVIICAALMCMASFEVLRQSADALASGVNDAVITAPIIYIMLLTIASKLLLYLWCGSIGKNSDSIAALAQDHFNDVLANVVALAALGMDKCFSLWWCDPLGAIILSLYIIWSWLDTAREQAEFLIGKTAGVEFLDEITSTANEHHKSMTCDHVKAYHFGPKFLVELEMILPKETTLQVSHDLGMELQWKIEAMDDVERCFVHMDYANREYDEHAVTPVNRMDL